MIKPFNKQSDSFSTRGRNPDWPDSPKETAGIFEPRKAYQRISVVVDTELIPDVSKDVEKLTKQLLLWSLLNNDLVKVYRYADNGPPEDVEPVSFEGHEWLTAAHKAYVGWAVTHPSEENGSYWPVTYATSEDSFTNAGVVGNSIQIAENDEHARVYNDLDEKKRAEKRKLDMLAYEVADQAIQADIYITSREYLFTKSRLLDSPGLTVCTLDEAIPMISLYLRAQGEFVLPTPSKDIGRTCNGGLFYWVGTREILPESWRWFSACVYHSSGTGNDKLASLGGAVLSRSQAAIEARDRVHIALNRKTNNDTNDDALGNLDQVLVLLMGAVDACARVAHYVLGLESQEYYSGWQYQDKWLKEVAKKAPNLSGVFRKDTRPYYALEILRLLRNSIHGEALQGVTLMANGKKDTVLKLPSKDEPTILEYMDFLGGRESWGYRPFAKGHDNVMPGLLVDKLVEETFFMVNEIMRETPIELLSHIEKANISNQPPYDESKGQLFNTFSEWNRISIRWQLGI